ncbi:MAG: helix-turn-helix domain-containing protein [Propionibacteriaceae bacterium]|nr:helix-turn-helix domain-containing protein [Propionibacteriaceae bacterium]
MTSLWEDHDACYSALLAHDARFDGRVFVGVRTTRIYCRPVCRVRTPRPENCRFYPSAAAAETAGFRPCLKCRPELAPGLAPVDGPARQARQAARLIADDPVDLTVEDIAARLQITSRQLRRVVEREYGVAPVRYLRSARLLLAKNLLTDTDLTITQVAFAAGFGSLRQFNDSFRQHYRLTPSQLRHDAGPPTAHSPTAGPPTAHSPGGTGETAVPSSGVGAIRLRLGYRPPYDWDGLVGFLAARAIPGVEQVTDGVYRRTVRLTKAQVAHSGWLEVRHLPDQAAVAVTVPTALLPALTRLLNRVRAMFDLDCEPAPIQRRLASLEALGPGLNTPGIRLPGAFDGFELAVRAILGQQVSVKAARTLAGRLAEDLGDPIETGIEGLTTVFPDPDRIVALPCPIADRLGPLGVTGARARAIRALAQAVLQDGLDLTPTADPAQTIRSLTALPGVGPWTAQYVAMRALAWPDAFPDSDLGLRLALQRALGLTDGPTSRQILDLAETWRPWRSYAALNLWRSLT